MADETQAPVTLRQGLPAEQSNGMFGKGGERIIALGPKGRFTAVVEFEVYDVVHSEAKSTRRPVVELVRVEPLWSKESIDAARAIHETAYMERTGADQLNFDGLGDDEKDEDEAESEGATVTDLGKGKKGQF